MSIYIVKTRWICYGEHRIEASNPEEAKKIVYDRDDPPTDHMREREEFLEAVPESDPMESGELE
jgi:hypothetical protein